jgi:hypothetical protein
MEYLIYISTAKRLLTEQELMDILATSRDNNERNNLTGVLLYSEGTFIQLLEGEHEPLNITYEAILHDERHKNIIKLTEGVIEERSFPDWTMGFRALNSGQLESIEGYLNPNKAVFDHEDKHPGIAMIKTFAASN